MLGLYVKAMAMYALIISAFIYGISILLYMGAEDNVMGSENPSGDYSGLVKGTIIVWAVVMAIFIIAVTVAGFNVVPRMEAGETFEWVEGVLP